MSEPRRSTRARAREEAAPAPEPSKETPVKGARSKSAVTAASTLKRKRGSIVVKDSTSTTPVADDPKCPRQILPRRILDGQPLPTLPEPQPLELLLAEWQDIQQSGVLSASMERSRAVWISGVNFRVFHKYFNQPKKPVDRTEEDKTKHTRQKDLLKNFPELAKDHNVNVKDPTKDVPDVHAQLVIEPHTFPVRLYAPREVIKQPPKKTSTPSSYGSWPNHNQPQHSQPNQYTQYNSHGQPIYQQKHPHPQPQPRPPPPPKPVQKAPPPTPGPANTPAPDPVIHMLAQRAGVDPELKSVMKIVAAGQASKQQLEFFQTHINELTAVLAKQKEDAKASKPSPAPAMPAKSATAATPATPTPPVAPTPPPKPVATPAMAPPRPVQPAQAQSQPQPPPPPQSQPQSQSQPQPQPQPQPQQQSQPPPPPQMTPQHTPKPYIPHPPQPHLQQAPPIRQPHPPYPPHYNQPPQQYHPPRQMAVYNAPPQPTGYRPLVFSFEEGNKDLLHFPSYSFMEWLPNMSGAKISFLITKMKPKPEPAAIVKPPSTPAQKVDTTIPPNATSSETPNASTTQPPGLAQTPNNQTPGPAQPSASTTPIPFVPPPRIEDFDEKNDIADIEFYQPVTVLLLTESNEIRQALVRAIRPPDVVEKYMDEVFDKCKRAGETYLAFRLPRDGDMEVPEKRHKSGDATPVVATPSHDVPSGFGSNMGFTLGGLEKKKAGRPRKSLV